MKKQNRRLLRLGISTFAILPFTALASCQGNNQNITLDSQMDKYQNSSTQASNEKAKDVANKINNEKNPEEKIKIINNYITLPTLEKGFSLEVLNATIGGNKNLDLIITIKITKDSNDEYNSKEIVITGFKDDSLIKINVSQQTKALTEVNFRTIVSNYEILSDNQKQEKINELKKLFTNVTLETFEMFEVEINQIKSKFVLIAKDGYTFGEIDQLVKKTVDSKPYIPTKNTKLEISTILEVTESDFSLTVEKWESAMNDAEKIRALALVFSGVKLRNIMGFEVTINLEEKIIILNANEGYHFEEDITNKTLSSGKIIQDPLRELKIIPKNTVTIDGFKKAKDQYESATTVAIKVIALNKLFEGVNETKFGNITVTAGDEVFTLQANEGYTFGTSKEPLLESISSVEKTADALIKIDITSKDQELSIEKYFVIKNEYEKAGNISEKQVSALNKLFTGVTEDNLVFFVVVFEEKRATLISNNGFTFGNDMTVQEYIVSKNPILLKELPISSQGNDILQYEFQKIINEYEKEGATITQKVASLNKVFDGVTIENFVNFDVSLQERTIILTAKEGYTFGTSEIYAEKTVISKPSQYLTKLSIKTKSNIWVYDFKTIKNEYQEANLDITKQVSALNKLFTGVTEDNLPYFDVKVGEKIFTLTAKEGYTFGNPVLAPISKLISFEARLLNELSIVPRNEIIKIHEYKLIKNEYEAPGATEAQKITALNKLFIGVTNWNFYNIKVTPGNSSFELEAFQSYTFGKKDELLKSKINSLNAMTLNRIDVIVNPILVTASEYIRIKDEYEAIGATEAQKITALNKLFKNVNETNMLHFEVKVGASNFTLIPKSGFTFGNIEEEPTNLESLNPNLDTPEIQIEIDKFKGGVTTMTGEGVAGVIVSLRQETDQALLKTKLNSYLTIPLPTLSSGFSFEIQEFIMTSINSMTIKILVNQTVLNKYGFANITITGFDINQTLEKQFLKLNYDDGSVFDLDMDIRESLNILNSSNLEDKKSHLSLILPEVDFRKIDKGFEAISLKAEIVNNNLLVSLVIKNNANGDILEKIVTISGWLASSEIQKLNIIAKPAVKQSIYNKAKSDWDTLVKTSSLSKLVRNQAKIDILNILFDGVTLANINNFKVSTGVSQFTLTAHEYFTFGEPEAQIQKTLTSMHPTADSTIIENELKKINDGTSLKQEGIVGAVYLLNKETDPAAQRVLFDTYFKLPTPSSGFTYTIGSITMVDGKMQVIINVSHTTEGNGTKTILIDGFLQLSLEDQLNKYTDFSLTKSGIFVEEYEKSFKTNNLVDKKVKLAALLTHSEKTIVIDEGFEVSNIKFISSTNTTLTIEISIKNLLTNEIKLKEITFSNFKAPLVVIGIKSKSSVDIRKSIFTKAKADWTLATLPQDKLTALSLIFDNVLIEDIDKFEVTFTGIAINEKFVLTAKDGFTFKDEFGINNAESIVSNSQSEDEKIGITNKRFSKEEFLQAASELENAANDTQKITALGKIFQGPSTNNINQFTYSIDMANYKVSLKADLGYTFNGKSVLDSSWPNNIWKVIGVTSKDVTINVLSEAYGLYLNSSKTRSIDGQISALQMVFEGVNDLNYNKQFTVSSYSATSFTLEAKENYTFSDLESTNTPSITTKPGTTAPNVVLEITPLPTPLTYKEWVQVRDEYNTTTTPEGKVIALNKLFTGVTKDNLAHFDVDINGDIFALKTKSGFEFSNGSDSISSLSPTYPIEILVSAQDINISIGLFNEVKDAYNKSGATPKKKQMLWINYLQVLLKII